MASRIVMELIFAGAEHIGSTNRKGKPLATAIGAFAGGALGLVVASASIPLSVAIALLGAVAGAALAAVLFRRPPTLAGARATDIEPFRVGAIVKFWSIEQRDSTSFIVLLERALYIAGGDSAAWHVIHEKLEQGEDPDLFVGVLIRLDEVVRVEMRSPDATEIEIIYAPEGRTKRCCLDFKTTTKRDELLAALERHFETRFSGEERTLEFTRIVKAPLVVASIAVSLFAGIAWLSAYWTANPPPFPRGKAEPDPLVTFLVGTGPGTILLAGAVLVLLVFAWLGLRLLRPPRVIVFQIQDG